MTLTPDAAMAAGAAARDAAAGSAAPAMPPAAAVLVACARGPEDQRTGRVLAAALATVTDWEGLGEAALGHGMAGLLYRRVADLCPRAVPEAVLAAWRRQALLIAGRSLHMERHAVLLLEAMRHGGVEALLFKGPAFSQQLYGDSALRHFADLDVLVRPRDVFRARGVALCYGYADDQAFDAVPFAVREVAEQEIALEHVSTGLQLEVHWRIGPRLSADSLQAGDLLQRAEPLEMLGRTVLALEKRDVPLVVGVHAAAHGWARIEDVAAMTAALSSLSDEDASVLAARAAASGCRRRLHMGVLMARVLAEAPVPGVLLAGAVGDERAKSLAAGAAARLVWSTVADETARQHSRREAAGDALAQARALDDSAATARHLWRRLLTAGARDWTSEADVGPAWLGSGRTALRRQRRLWTRRREGL